MLHDRKSRPSAIYLYLIMISAFLKVKAVKRKEGIYAYSDKPSVDIGDVVAHY